MQIAPRVQMSGERREVQRGSDDRPLDIFRRGDGEGRAATATSVRPRRTEEISGDPKFFGHFRPKKAYGQGTHIITSPPSACPHQPSKLVVDELRDRAAALLIRGEHLLLVEAPIAARVVLFEVVLDI